MTFSGDAGHVDDCCPLNVASWGDIREIAVAPDVAPDVSPGTLANTAFIDKGNIITLFIYI